ncbi:hypothetical protein TIFTF001_035674 [Ficus carica]|uniref:Uncharacterized protein n=1 Tax=Ficus carica TaxID=3494 RepID=A0AA88E2U0_FICCA|nr:hypothetical protein TIFTF001_035674 [Ficus carica]
MEDLRHTAYAYYEAGKKHLQEPVKLFFEEMESNGDEKVRFEKFNRYMKTVDCAQFGTKYFFDLLRGDKNSRGDEEEFLSYGDVVTLLYIINSGRPFCEKCKGFVQGTYFTCVQCFEAESDYSFNVCPSCFYAGSYHHCHKEFMDPFVLLRLKKKQIQSKESTLGHTKAQPMASNPGIPSSQTAKIKPNSSKAVVVKPNPQHKTVQPSASNPIISSSQKAETKSTSSKAIVAVPNPQRKTVQPSASNLVISSSQTAETEPSSLKAIMAAPNPPRKTVQPRASNRRISSSQTVETEPNSSKAIVVTPNPQREAVSSHLLLN